MKFALLALGIVGAAYVVACGPFLPTSIHFGNETPDFGRPVPYLVLPGVWDETTARPIPHVARMYETETEQDWEAEAKEQERLAEAAKSAIAAEVSGDYKGALALWTGYYDSLTPDTTFYDIPTSEFAKIRCEALALTTDPAPRREYLTLTRQLREDPSDAASYAALKALANQVKGDLAAYVWYALAGTTYDQGRLADAVPLYQKAASLGGKRAESAAIMAIRCTLGEAIAEEGAAAAEVDIAKGRQLIKAFREKYPNSRFSSDLSGWELRADFLSGNHVDALAGYLEQLGASTTTDSQASRLISVRRVLAKLTPAEAKEFRERVMDEPDLLSPYLDYRLYHTEAMAKDFAALAKFAEEVRTANPHAEVDGPILARLAEIEYLQGRFDQALAYAEESLESTEDGRADLATYVKAGVLGRKGQAAAVAKTLADFDTKFAGSYLVKPALEQRAIAAEQLKDWSAAANDYRTLGYRLDLAYLFDIRMSPDQVELYASNAGSERDKFALAAGYRYLRIGNWDKAEVLFRSIDADTRKKMADVGSKDYAWLSDPMRKLDTIPDPYATTKTLAKMSADGTPKGMYALASYYYDHRNLMLYNADLWQGSRQWIGWAWNDRIANDVDRLALKKHHLEHECLNHAREICLAMAAKYPKHPLTAKALYRAATATRRLAGFNPYWRNQNRSNDRYRAAAALLKRVYTQFPKDPLANKAKKYEKVFLKEGKEARQYDNFGKE